MKQIKIAGIVLACASLSGIVYFGMSTRYTDGMDLLEVVEAKSNDYVEPYVETSVTGVSNNQSEFLEDGVTKITDTPDKELAPVKVEVNPIEKATVLTETAKTVAENKPVVVEYVSRKDYTGVVPNEMNEIIIAMYHGVTADVKNSETVHRSISGFKRDLQTLYDNGYRAVTMEDLMTNNISVPAGYTPIVLTFDDGLSSQMSMVYDENENLVVKEDTAVDIINDFNKTHPDFGTHAMFYVYTSQRPFRGKGTYAECAEYLLANGYEVGAHTYTHPFLDKLSAEGIQMELAYNAAGVAKNVDNFYSYDVKYLAYPYGVTPKDQERRQYLLNGSFDGFNYNFNSAVLAAPNLKTSSLIYSNNFDPYRVGRYRGTNNATLDLNWKVKNDQTSGDKYISDGDPNTVTILEKDYDKVNLDALDNKTLRVIKD